MAMGFLQATGVGAISGILGGAVGAAIVSGAFGLVTKFVEPDPKVTDLAITILQIKPDDNTKHLRSWAVETLNGRVKSGFTQDQKTELMKLELPRAGRS